jgi:hypothetical protein
MTQPGVQIDVPARSPADAAAPIVVTMTADAPTYYANNGILDRALQVVLVRRDAPGVGFLAKTDPSGLFLPEPPLPLPADARQQKGLVREQRAFRLTDYGAKHDGAASYFVLATFARWASEPLSMEIDHAHRSVGPGDAMPAPPRTPLTERLLASGPRSQGVGAAAVAGPPQRIDGALRVPFRLPRFRGGIASGPWVTLVVWQSGLEGRTAALSMQLEPRSEGTDHVAAFSIPLSGLSPQLAPGPARGWVFSGDHMCPPFDFEVLA